MQFVSRLAVSAVATSHSFDSGDWSDWECPGFPCFIVNYYEFREHDDPKQVCTPVSDFTACSHLANAEDFAANKTVRYNWTNHVTTLGWHRMKGKKHQCGSVDYKCTEVGSDGKPRCPNSNVKCRSNCKALNLLDLYMVRCNKQCDYLCPDGAPVPSPPTPTPAPTPTTPAPTPTTTPTSTPAPTPSPTPSPEPSVRRRRRRRTAPIPAPPAPKPSPSDGLNKCTQGCMAVDTKHFNNCEEDGTTDCSSSKCCNENGATCYVKNQYWSACQRSCDPSNKDPFDGQHWQCSELTPPGCTSLRSCVDGCQSAHARFSATLNSTRAGCVTECQTEDSKAAHGPNCEVDGTTDCSSSRCCQDPDAKCMRKNEYWSACVKVCRPGQSDEFDGQPWECKDRTKMPSCASFRGCLASC